MRLIVLSYKLCWPSSTSPSGYTTAGGFPLQMQALSELFDETRLLIPCVSARSQAGQMPLSGHNLSVVPLTPPMGRGAWRKVGLLLWLIRNGPMILWHTLRSDAIHTPIPGDIGTFGMLLAFFLGKPLFVRHCGNWFVQRTAAERFWKWFMERFAGDKNVMLATGGAAIDPSPRNPNIRWIFATSLTEAELQACARRRRYNPASGPRLIIACRQEWDKGTDVVIKSLPLILNDFPEATLDVVGDGAALAEFRVLAAALDVANRVTFHGRVSHWEVLQLFQQADLFCYPTTASEGFPKVVHEALACGLPVITSRVSVLPQLIGAQAGLLIDETTPQAVAQAVYRLLTNPNLYGSLSAKAVETARHYSLEQWRDAIGKLLRQQWGELRSNG